MTTETVKSCFTQLFALFGTPGFVHSDRGPSFMSKELKDFLHSHQIATSHSSPYNPQGNGQVERYNGTLWKAISLQLVEHGLDNKHWEQFLPDALHSIRFLLCTATNATPHERFFTYNRRTANGTTLPTWLTNPGPVLLKRHVRQSKYEPLVEEAELLDANSQYAHIKMADGVEKTVSLRHLAPCGEEARARNGAIDEGVTGVSESVEESGESFENGSDEFAETNKCIDSNNYVTRAGRIVKPVDRLCY